VTIAALPSIARDILDPDACRAIEPALATRGEGVWVYRYRHVEHGWRLSVATLAEPGSGKMSLGGFRIAPESRTSLPGWDADREAIGLALGMEEKVRWSRLLRVGGPRAQRELGRVVGGKCVAHPTPDARIGQPRDRELLDFALACFRDVEAAGGIRLTTGQDLGHGALHDGSGGSLEYLNARFAGSVLADTSRPTAEGNFNLLVGMLRGCGVELAGARIGVIGAGNIGRHLIARVRARGGAVLACELSPAARAAAERLGAEAWPADRKMELLARPLDAIVVSAAGGSLDDASVAAVAANPRIRVVCGSENLAMPDEDAGARRLLAARTLYAPTELGGMMGYLTAVEEYLTRRDEGRVELDALYATLLDASRRLEVVGEDGAARVIAGGWRETFAEVVRREGGMMG
jgi:hypothetical protein